MALDARQRPPVVQAGDLDLDRVLRETGGAVALCSLTTIIGYSSLLVARNQALISFGLLADLGEVACLAAALFALPALLRWRELRIARAGAAADAEPDP